MSRLEIRDLTRLRAENAALCFGRQYFRGCSGSRTLQLRLAPMEAQVLGEAVGYFQVFQLSR
jgi:hypothetical protein